ncbi:MAG: phosphoglycerate kinase [Candidatus Saccharibacteria bacterium]|nr:phosphoglycerate kinase [Candidatus Saccharibacteria bacterium]
MKTIRDIDVKDKTVLVRVDYNVPLKDGKITDDLRIRASLPTLELLRKNGARRIVLISHLGRPEGIDKSLSLAPVAERLNELIGNVDFIDKLSGTEVTEKLKALESGGILLLENLRFFPGEKANDPDFIKSIIDSTGAELYVQDGFAVVHRAHASTDAVKNFLPVYAGLLLEKEVNNLSKAIENPEHPVLLIIGGAKVEDKQPLIDKFTNLADHILVGGKIAADGYQSDNPKIIVANDFDENSVGEKLDVGPFSTSEFVKYIESAKTIIWNGALGKVEDPAFATSSSIIADAIGKLPNVLSVICGGDTTGFVENHLETHPDLHFSLISTGGGAALEFLLGKDLPGLNG